MAAQRRGVAVRSLAREHGEWRAELGDGDTLVVQEVVLATGKHDLRGYSRPRGPQGDLVAMKMYWRLLPEQAAALGDDEAELRGTIERFRAEELEHRDIGLENEAELAPAYALMSRVIKLGCKVAIAVSERV